MFAFSGFPPGSPTGLRGFNTPLSQCGFCASQLVPIKQSAPDANPEYPTSNQRPLGPQWRGAVYCN